VKNAPRNSPEGVPSRNTPGPTQERDRTRAGNAVKHSQEKKTVEDTNIRTTKQILFVVEN
jgi:hypothetical protein